MTTVTTPVTSSTSEDVSLESNGIFMLSGEIMNESVDKAIRWILESNLRTTTRPDHLKLIINSPGGDLSAAFALIDVMQGSNIPIHTYGLGQISSCGLLIFMTGEPGSRTITKNTSILSHQWSWGVSGKEHELFAAQKEFDLTRHRMLEHYMVCTKMTKKKIEEILLPPHDIYLDATEAKKFGIADKIAELTATPLAKAVSNVKARGRRAK